MNRIDLAGRRALITGGAQGIGLATAAARTPTFDQMSQEHIDYMLSRNPLERFLEPSEAGAIVAWPASEECSFATGGVFDISGGRAAY